MYTYEIWAAHCHSANLLLTPDATLTTTQVLLPLKTPTNASKEPDNELYSQLYRLSGNQCMFVMCGRLRTRENSADLHQLLELKRNTYATAITTTI